MEENVTDQMTIPKPKKAQRMANLELLRCIAMMMVIVLHYLGKSDLLVDLTENPLGSVGMTAWFLESFCIVAVNAYMLISGYFLCMSTYKPGRLIKLYLQVWFYSVGVGVLSIATGIFPWQKMTIHDLLTFVNSNLVTKVDSISIEDVRVGDILRLYNDSHSVIILEVHSDYVVIAEGNYNSSIHWGRKLTAEDVAAADYIMTRYPE